jgi:integrase
MANPTPVWTDGKWHLDLRTPWGFGRYVLDVGLAPPEGTVQAVHAAHAKLAEMRQRFHGSQLDLPLLSDGKTVAEAIPLWLKEKRWRTVGGEDWTRQTAAVLLKELGQRSLRELDIDVLTAYRDARRAGTDGEAIGPQAMSSRLTVLRQALAWAAMPPRRWIPFVPPMPSPKVNPDEKITRALTKWVDEGTFRAMRGALYDHRAACSGILGELRDRGGACDAAAVRDLVEKRRLYLSFAFYTGMRRHDLNELTDADVNLDMRCYWRSGRKTGVERAPEAIPAPLMSDLLDERRRLGRPYREGEMICGGPWRHVARVMAAASKRVEVVEFNLMDCRRSFVYHKALAGVAEDKLVRLMGHSDSTMIRTVYLQLTPRLQRDEAGAAWPEQLTLAPGTGNARVIPLRRA